MKNRNIVRLVTLLAAIALLGAACGSSDASSDTQPIIVVESPTDDNDTQAEESSGGTDEDGTDEDQALAFAQCMRDEGIDFPDPVINADGSIDFSGVDRDDDNPDFDAALDDCSGLLEGSSFLPSDGDVTEIEDGLLAVAECLRDNGIDVPDPQIDADSGRGRSPFGDDFDPDDPATAAALDACQDLLAELGL